MARAVMLIVAVVTGCSSEKSEPPPAQPLAPPLVADAGIDGITEIGSYDPTAAHLDDDGTGPRTPQARSRRPAEPIGIMLKSTPPGAIVAVDGRQLGRTPKYWPGQADGEEHEFTFNLERHAMARYRFVPITSGVLHATLVPVTTEAPDAGLGPVIAPTFAPDAAVAPPPTILTPPPAPRTAPIDAAPPPADVAPIAPAPDAERLGPLP